MNRRPTRLIAALLGLGILLLGAAPAFSAPAQPSGGLSAFRSDSELRAFLLEQRRNQDRIFDLYPPPPPPPPPAPPPPPPPGSAPQTAAAAAPAFGANSITNNQEASVDEGDIVKARGELLIILRRGRLFTVSTAGGGLRSISAIAVTPPGVTPTGEWFDEMLVSGDHVVVIGYSYARGGTQINRFRLDAEGRLTFEDAYQLKSSDYYSSRNYASRLIGATLILYSPLPLPYNGDPLAGMPALRKWNSQTDRKAGFKRIGSVRQIYVPASLRDSPWAQISTLHTVTRCDLTAPVLACTATGVLGPDSRSFYVSGSAVYLWTGDAWFDAKPSRRAGTFLYRLPLNGQRPAAVRVRGAPVDQFSFREDRADGVLNVLVRSESQGDAMWRPEFSGGATALLRLPFSDFSTGQREAPRARYRDLPKPEGNGYDFQNRYVGGWLLYGLGRGWGPSSADASTLNLVPLNGGPVAKLPLSHSIDRIDLIGADGIVIGGRGQDVVFSAINLSGPTPALGDSYVRPGAAQAESRSHAFFYRPDNADGSSGLMGLPIAAPARPVYYQLFQSSASMVFIRRQAGALSPVGELPASSEGIVNDGCVVSCVDWYGNARPIFMNGRVFALLGYELVEGRVEGGRIAEVGRLSYAPAAAKP